MNNKLKLAPIFAVFVKLSVDQDQVFSTTFLHLSFNHAVMMILFDFFQPYNREVCVFFIYQMRTTKTEYLLLYADNQNTC